VHAAVHKFFSIKRYKKIIAPLVQLQHSRFIGGLRTAKKLSRYHRNLSCAWNIANALPDGLKKYELKDGMKPNI
jgi:hypothetical protein